MSWAALLSDLGSTNFKWVSEMLDLSRAERLRVAALRDRPVEDWSWLARRRAVTTRHTVRKAYLDRLVDVPNVIRSGLSALKEHRIDLRAQDGDVELYLAASRVDDVLSSHLARLDPSGHVIVHTVDESVFEHVLAGTHGTTTSMTVGVDLAESIDARTRRAGYDLIRRTVHG
jgi:hypothetical protein